MFIHSHYNSGAISYGGKQHLLSDTWIERPKDPKTHPRHRMMCSCPNSMNGHANLRVMHVSNNLDDVTCKSGQAIVKELKARITTLR